MNVKGALLGLFFFFLTTSLFLGDGKQPFVDAWWALGILMMYGIRYYQRGRLDLRPLPRLIGWAWTALILYYVILIPFSDSAGYSITATIRLIEAYLVYVMFATISSERTTALFTKGLLFVGVVATFTSFIFLLSPSLAGFLPPMNLLYTTYGHNHLADLLLFVFPVAIRLVEKKRNQTPTGTWRNIVSVGPLALFTLGMLLTLARGAWLLLVFYLLFLVWRSKNITIRRVGLFVAAATTAVFLFISLASFRGVPQKPSLLEDGRWEYWRQAIEAIKERPPFGSGPGTFYLQSKRLQSAPSSYSWFAHSFPLQITVETGVVGLAIFLFLFWNVLRKSQRSPLLLGAALVLVYGFYEFSLDYLTIWLLVWAALGVLTKHKTQEKQSLRLVAGALATLVLFYASNISSLAVSTITNNKTLAFFLAPYNTNTAEAYLDDTPSLAFVLFFHKFNADVLFKLAQKYDTAQNALTARRYYKLSKELDPLNEEQQKKRMGFYLKHNEFWLLFNEYRPSVLNKHPQRNLDIVTTIAFSNEEISTDYSDTLKSWLRFSTYSTEETSKNLFFLGFFMVDANPLAAKQLFAVARSLSPNWSYFHLALASYYEYYENQEEPARSALKNCLRFEYAGDHCADVMALSIPSLNEIKDYVLTMP